MENKPFDAETQQAAYKLINAGRPLVGRFWRNRTSVAEKLGYGNWEHVPENIKSCVEQIRLGAWTRRAKQKKAAACSQKPPIRRTIEGFVLSKDTLSDIADRALLVPKTARPDQIKIIREYITRRAGFDPARILLQIHSYMEH